MYHNRQMFWEHDHSPMLPSQHVPSHNFVQSSTSFDNSDYYSSSMYFDPHHSLLLSPNNSEHNSPIGNFGISHTTFSNQQPIENPHERFLTRTIENCPKHLTGSQRTRWLKAGRKAQQNQQLLSNLTLFHWPESNYELPIHIHHQTSESHLYGIINKISHVRLYTIDTESDKPTRQYPHSVPALIQVQAIHDENCATVILIEVQHLPHSSTSLFGSIQQLCRMIFSPINKLMAWGDLIKELSPFEQFNLFDISQVTNTMNLQEDFARHWNKLHPHTEECLAHHQPMMEESISDDVLVCLVNSDDLNDEFDSLNPINDFNTCICPNEIRPYKTKNSLWSLQKAIQFTFRKALDKSMTLNIWSCGLDLCLNTWHTETGKRTRQNLISYAINDLFACTDLYFHFNRSDITLQQSIISIGSHTVRSNQIHDLPLFLIISDSHGKYLPPIITSPHYKLIVKSISGLQWINNYNSQLCARSFILSSSISSILSSCSGVLFLVGTNSVRNTLSLRIMDQIDDIIDLIRSNHIHLSHKSDITISSVFPCFKSSSMFPSNYLLTSNLNNYNELLKSLATRKNFSVIDIPITSDHLNWDGMHVHVKHLSILSDNIQNYFNEIIRNKTQRIRSQRRSRAAITRRNKKRNDKLKQKQKQLTVIRLIHRIWKLKDLKTYLKHKNIKYTRLPEIYHHKLRIQFNHPVHQQYAEQVLTLQAFDEKSYYEWCSQEH